MTKQDKTQLSRLMTQKSLSAADLKFIKRVVYQDSVFVWAFQLGCGVKPHHLNDLVRGYKKLKDKDSMAELIFDNLFLKMIRRPSIVVQQD